MHVNGRGAARRCSPRTTVIIEVTGEKIRMEKGNLLYEIYVIIYVIVYVIVCFAARRNKTACDFESA